MLRGVPARRSHAQKELVIHAGVKPLGRRSGQRRLSNGGAQRIPDARCRDGQRRFYHSIKDSQSVLQGRYTTGAVTTL